MVLVSQSMCFSTNTTSHGISVHTSCLEFMAHRCTEPKGHSATKQCLCGVVRMTVREWTYMIIAHEDEALHEAVKHQLLRVRPRVERDIITEDPTATRVA